MAKSTYAQNNFVFGELSPRMMGRFDQDRPIFKNGAKQIENFLIAQQGGIFFRPGTRFVAEVKASTLTVKLLRFEFSTTQTYILELGNLYMRFYANGGQVISGGFPVEIVTPFLTAEVFTVKTAQKADVMYLVQPNRPPQKLIRTSATTFTISNVPFVRGPFLDKNITAQTITPSADTGAGVTLVASSALFNAGHVGALWRVKDGVVKITAFADTTHVTGDVQAEPDGAAGTLGTGLAAVTDWAEGAFSTYRGFPNAVSFHEQRLYYGGTANNPQTFWGSVIGAYDNFKTGANDADAVTFELAADTSSKILWMSSSADTLKMGTQGGTYSASSGSTSVPISPSNIVVSFGNDYGVANLPAKRISNYLYYLQSNLFQVRELIFNFVVNRDEARDMTLLSDHILRDGQGAVDLDRQVSPNDRLWVVRADGQIAVKTRNAEQQVMGWARLVAGASASGDGRFETIAILPQEGADDQVWVVVRRVINGSVKRYVEYFSAEYFTNAWDPVRLDCSLTLDNPKVISGATQATPVVITAAAHGFANGEQVKIDQVVGMTEINNKHFLVANQTADTFELQTLASQNVNGTAFGAYRSGGQARKMVTTVSGLDHLNGETVTVAVDGGVPSAQQTFVVAAGSITLLQKAAVVHAGLPYQGTLQLLKLGDGSFGTGQTKSRRIYLSTIRVERSLGLHIGMDAAHMSTAFIAAVNDPLGAPPLLVTGDVELPFDAWWDKEAELLLTQDQPLPLFVLALVLRSEVEEK